MWNKITTIQNTESGVRTSKTGGEYGVNYCIESFSICTCEYLGCSGIGLMSQAWTELKEEKKANRCVTAPPGYQGCVRAAESEQSLWSSLGSLHRAAQHTHPLWWCWLPHLTTETEMNTDTFANCYWLIKRCDTKSIWDLKLLGFSPSAAIWMMKLNT